MKLALCIPTHHGRAETLRQLLDSVLRQDGLPAPDGLEITISDNASTDGTADLVRHYQRVSPFAVKYFRFERDMRGVRNLLNAVEMADADWCWILGSDDVIVEGGLAKVLAALKANPSVAGATVNKLNFDSSLEHLIGPDAPPILPADSGRTRVLQGFGNVMVDLGLPFSFMSAHLFRRDAWQEVVGEHDIEDLKRLRHFPHSFIYAQIARRRGSWLWIGDYCVVQRLGNFCLLQEKGGRTSLYSMEVLEDVDKVWRPMLGADSREYLSLMRRQFLFAWNPIWVRAFKCEPGLTAEEERVMLELCVRCFGRLALFWLTTYPLLRMPASLVRRFSSAAAGQAATEPPKPRFRRLRRLLRGLGIENAWTRHFDLTHTVAERQAEVARAWRRGAGMAQDSARP